MPTGARKATIALSALVVGLTGGVAAADPSHSKLVNVAPVAKTPAFLDGTVNSVTEVGGITIVGGSFTQASSPGGPTVAANKLAAYDTATGALLDGFAPQVDGDVYTVQPGPVPGTVYVGGQFNNAGGITSRKIALLDATTGAAVAGFRSPGLDGIVRDMERVGGRLLVGGNFATAGGAARSGLVSLNATTGAVDSYLTVQLTERHNNTGFGARAAIGAWALDVSPDGSEMVVVGNFRKADGLDRVQIVRIALGADSASITPWATDRFVPLCAYGSFDTYMRDVAYDPQGDYFVVATTGGGYVNTLCDSASRFETSASGGGVQPTWIADTGGDTLLSTAVSGTAVYVGGHFRWFNNSEIDSRAGAGAVPRAGIAALDPDSGLPLSWNPGRNPRGLGAAFLGVTDNGLYVGSDTDWIGNYQYKRPKLAYFALAGGLRTVDETQLGLPGSMIVAGGSGSATGLAAGAFDGTTAGPTADIPPMGLDWSRVRGAFLVGGRLFYGWDSGTMYVRSFNGSTLGAATELDPYNDPAWSSVQTGSGETYRGVRPNFYAQINSLTGLAYAQDRIYYTRSGSNALYWRWFNVDSGIVGAAENVLSANGFSGTRALTYADGTLWQVTDAGSVVARSIDKLSLGAPSTIATGQDWRGRALFVGPPPSQPPTAVAAAQCTDLTCQVSGEGSSDPEGESLTYSWDFGDDTPAVVGKNATHEYAQGGTYRVTLTVTDPSGAAGTSETTVTVAAPPLPPVAAASLDCTHLACTADGSGSRDPNGDALTYSWDFGDATPAQSGVTATHEYAAAGTYQVTLTVTDATGRSATTTATATATDAPQEISFVEAASAKGRGTSLQLTVPAGARPGDLLVLAGSVASSSSTPSAPAGFTLAGSRASNALASYVWTRPVQAGEAGTTLTLTTTRSASMAFALAAYRNVDIADPIVQLQSTSAWWSVPASPRLTSQGDTLLVEVWGASASWGAVNDFSVPAGTTGRAEEVDTGSGDLASVILVDSATTSGSVGRHNPGSRGWLNAGTAFSVELRKG